MIKGLNGDVIICGSESSVRPPVNNILMKYGLDAAAGIL